MSTSPIPSFGLPARTRSSTTSDICHHHHPPHRHTPAPTSPSHTLDTRTFTSTTTSLRGNLFYCLHLVVPSRIACYSDREQPVAHPLKGKTFAYAIPSVSSLGLAPTIDRLVYFCSPCSPFSSPSCALPLFCCFSSIRLWFPSVCFFDYGMCN